MSLPLQTHPYSESQSVPSERVARQPSEAISQRLQALNDQDGELPPSRGKKSRTGWLVAACIAAGAAAVGAFGLYKVATGDDSAKGLELQAVERGRIILSIVEKGELEAAKNTDVICKVRAKSPSNNIASSLKWLVDDGTKVRKGDIIVRLDDSGLKDSLRSQESTVAEKRSSLTQAEKEKEIIDSQNRSDINNARAGVELARIDLQKFLEGELLQKQKDILGRQTLAQSDLMQWRDKEIYSKRMVRRGYISPSQAQSDESRRQKAEIDLDKVNEERRVLDDFDSRRTELDLKNKLSKAEEDLKVAEIQAKAKEAQAMAKLEAAGSVMKQEESKLNDLTEDIRNCTIFAPNDGMVVYYVPESSRFGQGGQQQIIQVGENVREGQKLMRIPDLRNMNVKVKIHESLVPRMLGDKMRKTNFSTYASAGLGALGWDFVNATGLGVLPDLREAYLEREEEIVEYGLPTKIKISSLEKPLRGHVKLVSAVASSTDWMASDVKVYPAVVSIDEEIEGLKPGMSAEVTIGVEELDNVLRLPVHAVMEAGGAKFCYVLPSKGEPEKRILKTGLNNNKFIEIKEESDLKEGEQVVMNPRNLAERRGDLQVGYSDPGEGLQDQTPEGKRPRRNGGANGAAGNGAASPGVRSSGEQGPRSPGAGGPGGGQGGERRNRQGGEGGPGGPGAGGPGAGGPGAGGPGGGGPGGGGGGRPQMSDEQRQQWQKFNDDIKAATPAKRKQMIDESPMPANVKDMIKKRLRDQGLEIPD